MKHISIFLAAFVFLSTGSFAQTDLKLLEGPILGGKQIVKVVKQYEEEQKVTLTVYYEGISKEEPKQIKASITTGGDNPVSDINTALVDLPSGSGNVDISFTFTPTRSYTKPYISSRKVKILLVKKEKKEGSILEGIPGISDGGSSVDDWTAPKYVYLLAKQWRVSPPADNPSGISNIVIPVSLVPYKSAKYIKP